MMLRYSFNAADAADAIERAVGAALDLGLRTGDLVPSGVEAVSTETMGNAVVDALDAGH